MSAPKPDVGDCRLAIIMAKVLSLTLIYSQVPNLAADWVKGIGATPTQITLAEFTLYRSRSVLRRGYR
jgi:hypothetical protein